MDGDHRQPDAPDPLGRIGATLIAAAGRQRVARRRRRRSLVAVAAVAGLLVVAGGAAAVTGSTGVPAIDSWLAFEEEQRPPVPRSGEPRVPVGTPVPGTLSEPFEIELEGPGGAVAAGFREAKQGMACAVVVDEDYRGGRPAGRTCLSERGLRRGLKQEPARLVGGGGYGGPDGVPRSRWVGFTRPDVHALTVLGPDGERIDAVLSEPWEPYAPGPPRVRVFLAVGGPLPRRVRHPREIFPTGLIAELDDGRTVRLP